MGITIIIEKKKDWKEITRCWLRLDAHLVISFNQSEVLHMMFYNEVDLRSGSGTIIVSRKNPMH